METLEQMLQQVHVHISPRVYAHAQYLADNVSEQAQEHVEVFGVPCGQILGDKQALFCYIDDLFIPVQQEVHHASFVYDGVKVQQEAKKKGLDKKMLGWMHSHGSIDIFHSSIDHPNILTCLDTSPINFEVKHKDALERYSIFPSIIFNDRHDTPDLRVYAKRIVIALHNNTPIGVRKHYGFRQLKLESDTSYVLDTFEKDSIEQKVEDILLYNKRPVKKKQPITDTSVIACVRTSLPCLPEVSPSYKRNIEALYEHANYLDAPENQYWRTLLDVCSGKMGWEWSKRMSGIKYLLEKDEACQHPDMMYFLQKTLANHRYLRTTHPLKHAQLQSYLCKNSNNISQTLLPAISQEVVQAV